ncbi:MAG: nucleotide exchange factor GrpE [Caldilineaceae bacterium]|nr:nucleotide exchange factor GrpE [Caldilineaceae bacterium]
MSETKNSEETLEATAQENLAADGQFEEEGADPILANGDGADETDEITEEPQAIILALQTELIAAQAKVDEANDRMQRTAAEFQNSRKRQEKQLSDQIERAGAHLIQRLLPILDDFDLAFRNIPPELANADEATISADEATQVAWVDGFSQIHKKMLSLLEEQGLTTVEAGGEFDPARHEAISSEPNDDVESGHIIETLRVGYEYKGRVLRPALVRVAM